MGQILVGTSGYNYAHWRGVLYPKGLAQRHWLERYAETFATVELNATFYRLPTPAVVEGWRKRTPDCFCFAVKGSRYLTHMKQLLDGGPGLRRFYDPVLALGPKLGPILWQLPERMHVDPARLDAFLARQPGEVRCAVEFRGESWYTEAICDVLDRHGAAFVEHDRLELAPPRITGGWRYRRFHGTTSRYSGRYGTQALEPVALDLAAWSRQGDAYVYFNNDIAGHAVHDALDLLALLGSIRTATGAGFPEKPLKLGASPIRSREAAVPDPRCTPSGAPGTTPPRGRR